MSGFPQGVQPLPCDRGPCKYPVLPRQPWDGGVGGRGRGTDVCPSADLCPVHRPGLPHAPTPGVPEVAQCGGAVTMERALLGRGVFTAAGPRRLGFVLELRLHRGRRPCPPPPGYSGDGYVRDALSFCWAFLMRPLCWAS